MTKALTDIDTFDATITVPEGADDRTAGSVEVSFQGLANRTTNNNTRLSGIDTQLTAVPRLNTSVVKIPLTTGVPALGTTSWKWIGSAWSQAATISPVTLDFDITSILPASGTIDSVKMYVNGGSGHGAFPGVGSSQLPYIALQKWVKTSGAATVFGKTIDPATSNVEYEVDHIVETTGIAEAITDADNYSVLIQGENGAWGLADQLLVITIELGWTIP